MVLVDTSVWIDHFRHGDKKLVSLLNNQDVAGHDFIIGELALGHLRQRDLILQNLRDLPRACLAMDDEVLRFIQLNALFGKGIGYVDAHLLTSLRLTPALTLWTRDKRLQSEASRLKIGIHDLG